MSLCPCGTGKSYAECCQRYHEGLPAENALALMRSRYSGYALKKPDYIMLTTHPLNPSYTQDRKRWRQDILKFCQFHFDRLEILDFTDGDTTATVTFIAHLRQGNRDASFKEKSLFEKVNGRWLYKEGVAHFDSR